MCPLLKVERDARVRCWEWSGARVSAAGSGALGTGGVLAAVLALGPPLTQPIPSSHRPARFGRR